MAIAVASAAHIVTFDSAYGDHQASNTVYVAVKAELPIGQATTGAVSSTN